MTFEELSALSKLVPRKLFGDEDARMPATLERFGESPNLVNEAELWMLGTIEVLWLPGAYLGGVIRDGRVIWHHQVHPQDAALCPYPHTRSITEGFLCDGHFEELRETEPGRMEEGRTAGERHSRAGR